MLIAWRTCTTPRREAPGTLAGIRQREAQVIVTPPGSADLAPHDQRRAARKPTDPTVVDRMAAD